MTITCVLYGVGCEGSQMPHGIIVGGIPGQGREGVVRHKMTLANGKGLAVEPPVDRLPS